MASKYANKSCVPTLPSIVILCFLALSPFAAAQESPVRVPYMFEVIPLWGYRTGMSFPVAPLVNGTSLHVGMGSGQTYGSTFGVHIREDDIVQFSWTRQTSYARLQGTSIANLQPVDRFHGNFVHEYGAIGAARRVRFFVMSGVGVARIHTAFASVTQLSVGIGVGGRMLLTQHLGVQLQAEWLPMFLQAQPPGNCTSSCSFHLGGGALASQVGFTMGPIFRF